MTVYNSTVSAVPKEALVPKKEFLTSENTLKLVCFQYLKRIYFKCVYLFAFFVFIISLDHVEWNSEIFKFLKLASAKYFGESYDKWPVVLLEMMNRDSLTPRCDPAYDACVSALGAIIWFVYYLYILHIDSQFH